MNLNLVIGTGRHAGATPRSSFARAFTGTGPLVAFLREPEATKGHCY